MNELFLSDTAFFQGIRPNELKGILPCLKAHEKSFEKGDTILRAGDTVSEIGLVESGSVNIALNFYWGGRHLLGHVGEGDIFAENYAAIPGKELLCDVTAAEDTKILFLNLEKLLFTCRERCESHRKLIHNLVRISAEKSLNLSSRMIHTAPKSIRERLLSYLSEQAALNGRDHFSIPFSRQQLADYLAVDRSALSKELGKMHREGLILFRKNEFTLLEIPGSV